MTDNNIESKDWERLTIEKLLLEGVKEQRRKRRWSIIFKSFYLLIFIFIVIMLLPDKQLSGASRLKPHTALIEINGEISSNGSANADDIIDSLDDAFNDPNTQGIILEINSPGGSAVQASEIYREIMYLRQTAKRPKIYAVCSDMCTSAAYYIASATDVIYASQASLVGSIGVIIDSFGFVDIMKKVGVERRLFTAGSEKGFLDPFSPLRPNDAQYVSTLLESVHQQFIADVKKGRGGRLKENNPMLFSGLVWNGQQSVLMGLVDGVGTTRDVARNVIKNTNLVDYTTKPSLMDQLSKSVGMYFPHTIDGYLKQSMTVS